MKILLVHNSYQEPGGEDIVFEQEAQLLRSAGHDVLQYRRSNDELNAKGAVRSLGMVARSIWAWDSRRQVSELLQREQPDVVHVHNTFLLISPAVYAACREWR